MGGQILCLLLKRYFMRPRPSLVPALSRVQLPSFPSGHSMLAVVVYLTLGAILAGSVPRARLKLYILFVAMLLAFLVGMSRIDLECALPYGCPRGMVCGALLGRTLLVDRPPAPLARSVRSGRSDDARIGFLSSRCDGHSHGGPDADSSWRAMIPI